MCSLGMKKGREKSMEFVNYINELEITRKQLLSSFVDAIIKPLLDSKNNVSTLSRFNTEARKVLVRSGQYDSARITIAGKDSYKITVKRGAHKTVWIYTLWS